jgi:probable F420-dependent oxidoreductase
MSPEGAKRPNRIAKKIAAARLEKRSHGSNAAARSKMSAKGAKRPNRTAKKIAAARLEKRSHGSNATARAKKSSGKDRARVRADRSIHDISPLPKTGDLKFGLRLPSFALGAKTATLAEMGAYLRRAEDLGFDCAVSIDHLLLTPPAYSCTWLEPLALLSALAGMTRTIKLGTMVLVLPLRNPAYFAKEWATLDLLSGGRSLLGVGVGWHEQEFALMGVPHKERGRRMDEMLEAVTALWAGDNVSYEGQYYRFRNLTIDPKPVQTPHPPIWIGGGSQPFEKVYGQTVTNIDPVLRRIAKYAKTWVPHSSATADMVRGDWEKIQRFMADNGRKPGDMSKVYSNFVWVLKKGEKPETAIPHFQTYSGMDLPYWKEFYLLGEAEELAEKISAKVANLGGCEYIVLNPLNWGMEQLELLAGEVLPRVARP